MSRPLSANLLARIAQIKASLDDVYPKSSQEWIEGFELDGAPEREILVWECMAMAYRAFADTHMLSPQQKDDVLKCLLGCTFGRDEETLLGRVTNLAQNEIHTLAQHYRASVAAIYATDQLRQTPEPLTHGQALAHAREYLRRILDIRPCHMIPCGLYGFDPSTEYLFLVVRGESAGYVGGTEYLAVSKSSGKVRHAGAIGE